MYAPSVRWECIFINWIVLNSIRWSPKQNTILVPNDIYQNLKYYWLKDLHRTWKLFSKLKCIHDIVMYIHQNIKEWKNDFLGKKWILFSMFMFKISFFDIVRLEVEVFLTVGWQNPSRQNPPVLLQNEPFVKPHVISISHCISLIWLNMTYPSQNRLKMLAFNQKT